MRMKKFILGRKLLMSQIFSDEGEVIPVTVIEAGPLLVTQIKTEEKDGYDAIQVGFGSKRKMKKPEAGKIKGTTFEKTGVRFLREFRGKPEMAVGDMIDAATFSEGDKIIVRGTSKGKGFQGVVKRHNFAGADRTHGTKHAHRQPGSIGATGPQRVFKNQKMAGRMGGDRVSVKNLSIVKVDAKQNQLLIKGAVPGFRGALIEIVEA